MFKTWENKLQDEILSDIFLECYMKLINTLLVSIQMDGHIFTKIKHCAIYYKALQYKNQVKQ